MLQAVWQVIANYGLDTSVIYNWFQTQLSALAPLQNSDISSLYDLFASFAPMA